MDGLYLLAKNVFGIKLIPTTVPDGEIFQCNRLELVDDKTNELLGIAYLGN